MEGGGALVIWFMGCMFRKAEFQDIKERGRRRGGGGDL